jgi:hypothetical protein
MIFDKTNSIGPMYIPLQFNTMSMFIIVAQLKTLF